MQNLDWKPEIALTQRTRNVWGLSGSGQGRLDGLIV